MNQLIEQYIQNGENEKLKQELEKEFEFKRLSDVLNALPSFANLNQENDEQTRLFSLLSIAFDKSLKEESIAKDEELSIVVGQVYVVVIKSVELDQKIYHMLDSLNKFLIRFKGVVSMKILPHIVTLLLEHIQCQSLYRQGRLSFMDILETLIFNYPEMCKIEMILAFKNAFNRERDPEVMFKGLQLLPQLVHINKIGVDHVAEGLFDSLSGYFPLTYTPSPEQAEKVSVEALKETLYTAMGVTNGFAVFAYEFFLEKVHSSVISTRVEALKVLATISKAYGAETVTNHLVEIFTAIKTVLLRTPENDVRVAALELITDLSDIISNEQVGEKRSLQALSHLTMPAINELLAPKTTLAHIYSEVMGAIASSSAFNCHLLLRFFSSQLNGIYASSSTVPKRVGVLHYFNVILASALVFQEILEDVPLNCWQDIHTVVQISVNDDSLALEVIEPVARLGCIYASIKNDGDEVNHCFTSLRKFLLSSDKSQSNRSLNVIEWLYNFGQQAAIRTFIVEPLVSRILSEEDCTSIFQVISKLAMACPSEVIYVADQLIQLLKKIVISGPQQHVFNILSVFSSLLDVKSNEIDEQEWHKYLLEIIELFKNVDDDHVLLKLNRYLVKGIGQMSLNDQQIIADKLGFDSENPSKASYSMQWAVLIAMRVGLQIPQTENYFTKALLSSIESDKERGIMLQVLFSMTNKLPIETLADYKMYHENIIATFKNSAPPSVMLTLGSIAKGYILRGRAMAFSDPIMDFFIKTLQVEGKRYGKSISHVYGQIMQGEDDVPNVVKTIMYQQRFFSRQVRQLKPLLNQDDVLDDLLHVLSKMIESLPKAAYAVHVDMLYPLLMKIATSGKSVESALQNLALLLKEAEPFFTTIVYDDNSAPIDRLGEFIDFCLSMLLLSNGYPLQARRQACSCLLHISNFDEHRIKEYKRRVVRALSLAVGDPKRIVRQAARDCANNWYMVVDFQ